MNTQQPVIPNGHLCWAERALHLAALILGLLATACHPRTPAHAATLHDRDLARLGLGSCEGPHADFPALATDQPLIVLVHGCNAAQRSFDGLTTQFARDARQMLCFRYDDRERITRSADHLKAALEELARRAPAREVLVIGHSQGGLVARAALSDAASAPPRRPGNYRLVTISSPFGGIGAARHCGSIPYHIATFGVTLGICRAIGGAKWREIHPAAELVLRPPTLSPRVRDHLAIITDEREGCRRFDAPGRRCLERDYVFSVAEQHSAPIVRDQRVVERRIVAGHGEIVGVGGREPRKLLQALEHHGLMSRRSGVERVAHDGLHGRRRW